ncbi:putative NACHT, LRR and PYD domains-containing protein 10-like [Apostichopus japonicus]|uniref:Putative NACHT, LRR and PYD domains-containing protein 10-like n=1 Tax=Stichopus japonicus TaxID=307972 RepID=A0A2G8KGA7_STIJA|nr:putative NACHT, LRR and PYD domains-containing protein 10-like [Apostichopus japonicus]
MLYQSEWIFCSSNQNFTLLYGFKRSSCQVESREDSEQASILTFSHLKEELSLRLTKTDCDDLCRYFSLPPDQMNFLLALEEKGYIHPSNVNRLTDALTKLKNNRTHLLTEGYMKLRDPETEYDRFLGSLSAHLTISITEKLCDNFLLTDDNKNTVISSQNPGLSFLLKIDEMGIINSSDVSKLETPLEEYRLLQAVAKIHEYQSLVLSDKTKPQDEDIENFFIKCLRQKIKSWFETMTPVPWKKSCQWKSNDLFIASRLVLTTSGSKISSREVDRKCKLHYRGIFTDERLKAETRIILEGQPGSGKTMLSSQLAYDWCCGELIDIPMVIYLPLKIVDNMTIIQAIKMFYIRKGIPITEEDIESILNSGKKRVYLILDGLEEYNGETKDGSPSEVMRVITKEKLSNCIVMITARTDYAKHLPPGPMLKIGSFGEDERNEYIEKVFSDDLKRQEEVKELIDNVPFILDLCNVPLLFVLLVHNIHRLVKLQERQLDRVTPFVKAIVDILCPVQDEEDKRSHLSDQKTYITLEELAFNGLCKGNQQLFWQKDFVDRSVTNSKAWIDSGILVVEEATPFNSPDRNLQTDSGSGTPQTDSISDESLNTSNVTSEIKRGVSPDLDLSASVNQSERKPILESKKKKSISLQKGKVAKYVSLQVKFLHKLIQECFAAEYLARLFWGHKSTEQHYKYQLFRKHLANIDPADLHYVLRFTCHICPPSFHFIASFLMRDFKTEDFEIPDYIINCICLCFAEYDGYKGHKVKDIVKEVCRRESVNFSSGDSQLLLRSKVSMLTFASRSQIPIKCLKLSDVVEKVTEKALILKADVSLGVSNTMRAIEVSRWDQKLNEQDYEDLIKFIINNEKVEVAR